MTLHQRDENWELNRPHDELELELGLGLGLGLGLERAHELHPEPGVPKDNGSAAPFEAASFYLRHPLAGPLARDHLEYC